MQMPCIALDSVFFNREYLGAKMKISGNVFIWYSINFLTRIVFAERMMIVIKSEYVVRFRIDKRMDVWALRSIRG